MTGVVAIGVVAAFFFGLSAVLQQHAARRNRDDDAPLNGIALVRRLVRSRTWLAGQVADLCGFMSQAGALSLGSVAVVQPIITTELLFALGVDSGIRRRRPTLGVVVGGLMVCGGLALFLSVKGAIPANGLPDRSRLFEMAPIIGGVVVAIVAVTRRIPPVPSAIMLGTAAGIFFACSAVLIKLTTHDLFHRGVAATATDWPGYALAGSTATGLVLEQLAFATGPLAPGMTAMTITNPLVSYAFALVAFNASPPATAGSLAAVACAAAMLCAGVTLVSRAAARLRAAANPDENREPGKSGPVMCDSGRVHTDLAT